MAIILYALTGMAAGVISGLGIGGGVILIPALTMLFAVGQREAQAVNLLYFIPTGIIAVITHFKERNIDKRVLPAATIAGVAAAVLGALLAAEVDVKALSKLFGGFLCLIGMWEFFKKR